ncbi:conserved hypothetical protein [Neospora caninum Liverpool]|uniref:tRNA-uridine aminocarboxypropyltransferase n=1 Tax=Neospora caninum (strain Liverpool) TaxID=572307 RepID=F0VEM9_NEOCL|nr:conserved hypothetical protein [Neospora caninum Liverpool]CBZ52173.1 conserved hypothetical protein [Neospora caninum Liverpool]CEL66139.1 TPA: hypothetical protein BN1204_019620 [Neospora caninum Liverpool]|eukprot:XP_003882205.1 conserved hypothetical protein [Neospora caninum Liverpool]
MVRPGREKCSGCLRPACVCYCSRLPKPPLSFSDDFSGVIKGLVVYVHPLEVKRKMGSLPLLTRAVTPVHVFPRRKPGTVKLQRPARAHLRDRGLSSDPTTEDRDCSVPSFSLSSPVSAAPFLPPSLPAAASASPPVGLSVAPASSSHCARLQLSPASCAPSTVVSALCSSPGPASPSPAPLSSAAWVYDEDVGVLEGGCCTRPFLPSPRPSPLPLDSPSPFPLWLQPSSLRSSACASPRLPATAPRPLSLPSAPSFEGEPNNLLLLFPTPWSFELGAGAFPLKLPVTVLCLDGTWKEAKEMLNAAPWLAQIPAVRLPRRAPPGRGGSEAAKGEGRRGARTEDHAPARERGTGGDRPRERNESLPAKPVRLGDEEGRGTQLEERTRKEERPRQENGADWKRRERDGEREAAETPLGRGLGEDQEQGKPSAETFEKHERTREATDLWGAYGFVRTPSRKVADEGGVCTAEAVARSLAAIAHWSRTDCSERAKHFDKTVVSLLTFVAGKQIQCKDEKDASEKARREESNGSSTAASESQDSKTNHRAVRAAG